MGWFGKALVCVTCLLLMRYIPAMLENLSSVLGAAMSAPVLIMNSLLVNYEMPFFCYSILIYLILLVNCYLA